MKFLRAEEMLWEDLGLHYRESLCLNQSDTSGRSAEGDTREEIRGITQAFSEPTFYFVEKRNLRNLNWQTTMCCILGNYNVLGEFKEEEKRGGIIRASLHRRSKVFLDVYRGRGWGKKKREEHGVVGIGTGLYH